MSYPQIGSNTFISIDGPIEVMKQELEVLMRGGVNGQGYRKRGLRGREFALQTIQDLASAGSADDRMNTFKNLIGDRVTVTDGVGNSWSNMTVLDVFQLGQIQPVSLSTPGPNGTPAVLMFCLWTLQCNGPI